MTYRQWQLYEHMYNLRKLKFNTPKTWPGSELFLNNLQFDIGLHLNLIQFLHYFLSYFQAKEEQLGLQVANRPMLALTIGLCNYKTHSENLLRAVF